MALRKYWCLLWLQTDVSSPMLISDDFLVLTVATLCCLLLVVPAVMFVSPCCLLQPSDPVQMLLLALQLILHNRSALFSKRKNLAAPLTGQLLELILSILSFSLIATYTQVGPNGVCIAHQGDLAIQGQGQGSTRGRAKANREQMPPSVPSLLYHIACSFFFNFMCSSFVNLISDEESAWEQDPEVQDFLQKSFCGTSRYVQVT